MTKKILFMGTPQFSVPILQALLTSEYEVVGVVTQPDKVVGRKKQLSAPPVKQLAMAYNIPIFQPEKLNHSPELETILTMDIDLIVTAAYGQFLPEKLLHYPKFKAINVHASLLPKYRGGAPIQYALMNGDDKTGVTIMYMEKEMDAGDMLSQRELVILPEDNVSSLFDKLSIVGKELLMETLPLLFEHKITAIPQDKRFVSFSPAITKEQEKIDWQQSATTIHQHIKAMNGWPGAYTLWQNERFKIWESTVVAHSHTAECGTIIEKTKQTLVVACGHQTALALTVVQPAGKSQLTIQQFLNGVGHKIVVGDQFI